MLLLFATPMVVGFANYLVPLQIGAADMAFPRLNALSYWLFLFGGLIVLSGFLAASVPPTWAGRATPRSTQTRTRPAAGMDLWIVGVGWSASPAILGAVNFIATIYGRRAPGMTMFRVPLFTWAILVPATLILFAFPPLTAALAMLLIDRHFGGSFFTRRRRRPDPVAAPVLVLRPPRGLHRRRCRSSG